MFSFFARLHRRRMAAEHQRQVWEAEKPTHKCFTVRIHPERIVLIRRPQ